MAKYVTKDLAKASFVKVSGYDWINTSKQGKSVYFTLEREDFSDDEQGKLLRDYDNQKTSVEPVSFMLAMSQFRNKVYDLR